MTPVAWSTLLRQVRACSLCAPQLPLAPRPVLQADPRARILIAGQAPGRKVQESGVPFDDASGERLRQWMGVARAVFYDASLVAILPMGFCYPGAGASGDRPPRPECAPQWRAQLLAGLPNIELTLAVGSYAQRWHLPQAKATTLTEAVQDWRRHWPAIVPMPHPSPRNNGWLAHNPWFAEELIPSLRARVRRIVARR